IAIPGSYTGAATLEVLDYSAKDGSRQDVVTIPLVIDGATGGGSSEVTLYFTNSRMNPGTDCSRVFAVRRGVDRTPAIAERALRALPARPSNAGADHGPA